MKFDSLSVQSLSNELHTLNIIGHSIDIVAISSIQELIEQVDENFEMQCFTASERRLSEYGNYRMQYLAGRLCAKKAVLQILGIEWHRDYFWLDIEVQRLPTGKPLIVLSSKCQEIATALGIQQWLVSISHVSSYATASAIALGFSCKLPKNS